MRMSRNDGCGSNGHSHGNGSICSNSRPGTAQTQKSNASRLTNVTKMSAMTRASRVAASGDQKALGSILKRRSSMNRRATRSRMSLARNPAAAHVKDHPTIKALADRLKISISQLQNVEIIMVSRCSILVLDILHFVLLVLWSQQSNMSVVINMSNEDDMISLIKTDNLTTKRLSQAEISEINLVSQQTNALMVHRTKRRQRTFTFFAFAEHQHYPWKELIQEEDQEDQQTIGAILEENSRQVSRQNSRIGSATSRAEKSWWVKKNLFDKEPLTARSTSYSSKGLNELQPAARSDDIQYKINPDL